MGVDQPARFYGRKTKTTKSVKKIARQEATKVVMKLSETKYHDRQFALGADFNGAVIDLSSIGQGDTDVTRDGDKILPVTLEVGFNVVGETYSGIVRLIIFRWIKDSIPVPGDIMDSLGGSYATISPYQHDLRKNFQVLKDKTYTVSNNGGTELRSDQYILKMAKKTIEYYQGGVTAKNKIYALMVGDRALATSPGMFLMTRLNYKDF